MSPETKTGKNQKSVAVQIDKRRKTVLSRRIKLLAVRAAEFSDAHRIIANGPVVGLVAVHVRAGMSFCKVPVESRKHTRQGISVIGTLKVDDQELSRHNKVI